MAQIALLAELKPYFEIGKPKTLMDEILPEKINWAHNPLEKF